MSWLDDILSRSTRFYQFHCLRPRLQVINTPGWLPCAVRLANPLFGGSYIMFRLRALRLGLILLSLFTLTAAPTAAHPLHETAVATDTVFVRSGPSTNVPILGELYTGEVVDIHGEVSNGFISITRGGYVGWVHMDYLSFPDSQDEPEPTAPVDPTLPDPEPEPEPQPTQAPVTPEPEPEPQPTEEPVAPQPEPSGGIIWPVSGGEWRILQGYNGSSHQNNSSLWQYRDSLDLVRDDGATAGATVISPISGTVRWLDPSSGGISIDMGNGYAVAMFHVVFDSSLSAGITVTQGQSLGYISGPGEAGYASTPHLHIALWQTSDGGNWNRVSVPFQDGLAISGYSLPNNGSGFQHTGLRFNP